MGLFNGIEVMVHHVKPTSLNIIVADILNVFDTTLAKRRKSIGFSIFN